MRERVSEERREQVSRSGWRNGMTALPRISVRPEADVIGARSAQMGDSSPHTQGQTALSADDQGRRRWSSPFAEPRPQFASTLLRLQRPGFLISNAL